MATHEPLRNFIKVHQADTGPMRVAILSSHPQREAIRIFRNGHRSSSRLFAVPDYLHHGYRLDYERGGGSGTQVLSNKLQSFVNKCLRKILKIQWPEKISNKELRSRTRQEHIPTEIAGRKWVWIGHVLRKPGTNTTKQALKWNLQGKRKGEDLEKIN